MFDLKEKLYEINVGISFVVYNNEATSLMHQSTLHKILSLCMYFSKLKSSILLQQQLFNDLERRQYSKRKKK